MSPGTHTLPIAIAFFVIAIAPADRASAIQARERATDCTAVLAPLQELRVAMLDILNEIRGQRTQAEDLSHWFGREEFQSYVTALREHEIKLQTRLDEIAAIQCEWAEETPR